jgi:CBS domain-containing protein
MRVSEAMTAEVETVTPDQPIQEAARFMLSADTGVLPVVQDEVLHGMITDRDIAVRAVAEGRGPETPVGEVMTGHALFVYEDQSVEEAAALMGERQIRRLAVKSRDGDRLCGIISLADISRINDDETAAFALDGITDPGGEHNQSGND